MSDQCAVKGCERVPGGSWPLCSRHSGMQVDLDFAKRGELDDIMAALREAERERTQTPLGRTEDRPENVRAARSQREGYGQGPGTADPDPGNCSRPGCGKPRSEHDFGVLCP